MANQNYSSNPVRKVNASPKSGGTKATGVGKVPGEKFKTSGYPKLSPTQPRDRSMGIPKVKIYNDSNGL